MDLSKFCITEFISVGTFSDPVGKRLDMQSRRASSLIFTMQGRIRFTERNGTVHYSDASHPLYLPSGSSYLNECTETAAVSLMFTFYDNQTETAIRDLTAVDTAEILHAYDTVEKAVAQRGDAARFSAFSAMYHLLDLCTEEADERHPFFRRAVDLMRKRLGDQTLTVSSVASELFISEVYLRRIFQCAVGTSPAKYLLGLRMERAEMFLCENRSISEIAEAVGYSDIYSFSRSFRRHFGVSPSEYAKRRF